MLTKAIITIVENGNKFLPIWYRYYRNFFSEKDIYIFDYGTTDESLDNINANIISVQAHNIENVPQGNKLINNLKTELLEQYTYVMYADYDEIIYYEDGLDKLLEQHQEYYTLYGYEIVQNRKEEGPIDWDKPILDQRHYWYRAPMYDKSLITRKDFTWAFGNHSITREKITKPKGGGKRIEHVLLKPKYVPGLLLLHLHKVDYNHALMLNEKNLAKKDNATIGGMHNFFVGEQFEKWFSDAEKSLIKMSNLNISHYL